MLYEEQNIQWKHTYQCAKIAQSLQRNTRPLFALGLLCFYSSLNVFAAKDLRINCTLFVKPKCV